MRRESEQTIALGLRRVARFIVAASCIIVALGILREIVVGMVGKDTVLQDLRQIALDSEHSLPAWYSSLLMLANAGLLAVIATLAGSERQKDATRWWLLVVIFAIMALDEAVSFHEILISPLHDILHTSGLFTFAWVIPGSVVVVALGLYFLPFVLRLPPRTRWMVVLAGAIYVTGALVLEFVGGAEVDAVGWDGVPYIISFIFEESFEIIGLTLFFVALCDHLGRTWPVVDVELDARRQAAPDHWAMVRPSVSKL